MTHLVKSILSGFILSLLIVSCASTEYLVTLPSDTLVRSLLKEGRYTEAQKLYFSELEKQTITQEIIDRYDNFFKVIAIYDLPAGRDMDDEYRYASCVNLYEVGSPPSEWRSIAPKANPFPMSNSQILTAKQKLKDEGLWRYEINKKPNAEFQKAIIY